MTNWIVSEHKNWGDNIGYDGRDDVLHHWHGHTTPRPKLGDTLETVMKSGRTALFEITDIELCFDPEDMWFAKTSIEGKLK